MNILIRLRSLWRITFVRFLIIGGLNTIFGYTVYAGFILVGTPRQVALVAGTIIGVLFNFKTTGAVVFRNHENRLIFRFVLVYVLSLAFNAVLLEAFCRGLGVGSLLGGALCLPIVPVVTFVMIKRFVFRQPPARSGDTA